MQIALPGKLAQVAGVFWFVPRDMQRYCRSRTNQFVNGSTVFQLFINVARFARARETRKTSPSSADSPRWNGKAKALGLRYQIFDVNILPSQLFAEMFVVFFDPVVGLLVLFGDERIVNLKMRWHSAFLRECPTNFRISEQIFSTRSVDLNLARPLKAGKGEQSLH